MDQLVCKPITTVRLVLVVVPIAMQQQQQRRSWTSLARVRCNYSLLERRAMHLRHLHLLSCRRWSTNLSNNRSCTNCKHRQLLTIIMQHCHRSSNSNNNCKVCQCCHHRRCELSERNEEGDLTDDWLIDRPRRLPSSWWSRHIETGLIWSDREGLGKKHIELFSQHRHKVVSF